MHGNSNIKYTEVRLPPVQYIFSKLVQGSLMLNPSQVGTTIRSLEPQDSGSILGQLGCLSQERGKSAVMLPIMSVFCIYRENQSSTTGTFPQMNIHVYTHNILSNVSSPYPCLGCSDICNSKLYRFRSRLYVGNSISKLQIQVTTYVFELSAGNCHR